jgi:hypothetical protein
MASPVHIAATGTTAFAYSGQIVEAQVERSGTYDLSAVGADGGGRGGGGGRGAEIAGDVYLQAGALLEIVVGGKGSMAVEGGGGGGGSFVIETFDGTHSVDVIEAIAGGGGGAYDSAGGNGQAGPTGGGFNGSGGVNGAPGSGVGSGAGGGGGFTGGAVGHSGSDAGTSFKGGAGGPSESAGGFGGGGAGSLGGGGGGGYGGGRGGGLDMPGGGGGSYFNGTASIDQAGANTAGSGEGSVTITYEDALCYLRGTRVLTPTGEVPVEALNIGDRLVTRFGGMRTIRWIGRQSYDWRFVQSNPAMRPVRIRAGALGEATPARDLLVSGGHSLLIGGTLVLARALINGITIVYEHADGADPVDYHQIDFFEHDCIVAEGAFAESFADGPSLRGRFHNARDFAARYPGYITPDALQLCADRPERGAALAAALAPIVARASDGLRPGPLEGFVDIVTPDLIEGWALDTAHPFLPVMLDLVVNGEAVATILACDDRADLRAAAKADGRCAFSVRPPGTLPTDATIALRRTADGARLPFAIGARRLAA